MKKRTYEKATIEFVVFIKDAIVTASEIEEPVPGNNDLPIMPGKQ